MTLNTSFVPALNREDIHSVFGIETKLQDSVYTKFYKKMSTNMEYDVFQAIAGYGVIPVKEESADTLFVDPLADGSKTLVQIDYSLGFKVSERTRRFNKWNTVKDLLADLARSAQYTKELLAHVPLNTGKDAYTLADGSYLIANNHTLPNGSTASNINSANSDLSKESLRIARVGIAGMTDGAGKVLGLKPSKLIVHPMQGDKAREIVNSQLTPESNNNAVNTLKGIVEVVESPYITDQYDTYITTNHSSNFMELVSKELEMKDDGDFRSDDWLYKILFSTAFGAVDYKCVWGINGLS